MPNPHEYSAAFSLGTELGRLQVKNLVAKAVGYGWVTFPKPVAAKAVPDVQRLNYAPGGREDHGCPRLTLIGSRLVQPFKRCDLVAAAHVKPEKASNVMTTWKRAGWIVGNKDEGWTRTSGFGDGAVQRYTKRPNRGGGA